MKDEGAEGRHPDRAARQLAADFRERDPVFHSCHLYHESGFMLAELEPEERQPIRTRVQPLLALIREYTIAHNMTRGDLLGLVHELTGVLRRSQLAQQGLEAVEMAGCEDPNCLGCRGGRALAAALARLGSPPPAGMTPPPVPEERGEENPFPAWAWVNRVMEA